MIINNSTGITTAPNDVTSDADTGDIFLDKDVFMELLLTQMQNQDPLDPLENTEFTEQLAMLSSVEQLQGVNTNLETLQMYQSSINNAQSVALIGKEVKALGNTIDLEGSGNAELHFILADDAKSVEVLIKDDSNKVVASISTSDLEAGECTLDWDGLSKDGVRVEEGEYTFEVNATDASGESVAVDRLIEDVVTGISFENGTPYLMVGSRKVTLGDIFEVNWADDTTSVDGTDDGST